MTGKDKCRILKDVRREIAEQNEIVWDTAECTHKGDCRGTCPHCENEVRKLEKELEKRRKLGKTVALVGISAACLAGLAACGSRGVGGGPVDDLSGDVPFEESTTDIEVLDGEVSSDFHDSDEGGTEGDMPELKYRNTGESFELSGYIDY